MNRLFFIIILTISFAFTNTNDMITIEKDILKSMISEIKYLTEQTNFYNDYSVSLINVIKKQDMELTNIYYINELLKSKDILKSTYIEEQNKLIDIYKNFLTEFW